MAASVEKVAARKTAKERAPAKSEPPAKGHHKTAKRPAKRVTAKDLQEVANFAVSLDEIDTSDLADQLFNFAVTPIPEGDEDWRIEKRERARKDGATVTYWNFRARKSIKVDGKRKVPYRKGGKHVKG